MAVSKDEFRRVMGLFATGVTVITSRLDGEHFGMTANAVTSVSLEPMLFLVCVDHSATTHEAIAGSGVFAVNILSEEQEELSRRFATKRQLSENQMEGVAYHLSGGGCPILDGCLAFLDCRVADTCAGGDHTIFLGEVEEAGVYAEGRPLLFYRSRYAKLA
ncbi:MAG: flavin reductase family protein, partial [Dehalococcoidia bacterium]